MGRYRRYVEMKSTSHIEDLLHGFANGADELSEKSKELVLGLLVHSEAPASRDQFAPGHLTATAVVLHPREKRFLLVHHRRLDRWLLPGGHVEDVDEFIWETARREAVEETGVNLRVEVEPRMVGVDVHGIPPRRKEPFHLHHDLIFCFRAGSESLHGSEETRDVVWCSLDEFDRYDLADSIRRSVLRALARE